MDKNQIVSKRGYLIANYTIHDQEVYQKYIQTASLLNERFGLKPIIYDAAAEVVEGDLKAIIVVAEFQSLEAAKRFYHSPEYQEAMKLRVASTSGSVMLAESYLPS